MTSADAREAIRAARSGFVAEGPSGRGRDGHDGVQGRIGTSSRALAGLGTVGVLVLANFSGSTSSPRRVAVGTTLAAEALQPSAGRAEAGSCIGVVATDIPLTPGSSLASARRVGLGLARLGGVGGHGSGEIFCAFSTTNRRSGMAEGVAPVDVLGDGSINAVFAATVDATEEAVTNALFVADTVVGRDGHVAPGLPVDRVLELVHHP